jgi:hypothetical protein
MPKRATPAAQFQLLAIELRELTIHKNPGFPVKSFHYEISIENAIDREEKIVIIMTRVSIFGGDGANDATLGNISCECIFSVENFDEVVAMSPSGDSFEILEPFAETISSISASTTRGYMASELKGTILHNAFLPIVDIKSLSKVRAR